MEILLFLIRLAVLVSLYFFLTLALVIVWKDLKLADAGQADERSSPPVGRLVVVQNGNTEMQAGDLLRLDAETPIGRALDNKIVLLDGSVSAFHALLTYRQDSWWLRDVHSTNGTTLNGRRVEVATRVQTNDVIGIGQIQLRFEDS